jgi:hypothetical protein
VVKGEPLVVYKPDSSRESLLFPGGWNCADGVAMMAVTLGRKKATGRSGGLKIPGFVIWFVSESSNFRFETNNRGLLMCDIEGRTLFTQKQAKYVNGTEW